jgi:hypothetical protein
MPVACAAPPLIDWLDSFIIILPTSGIPSCQRDFVLSGFYSDHLSLRPVQLGMSSFVFLDQLVSKLLVVFFAHRVADEGGKLCHGPMYI